MPVTQGGTSEGALIFRAEQQVMVAGVLSQSHLSDMIGMGSPGASTQQHPAPQQVVLLAQGPRYLSTKTNV